MLSGYKRTLLSIAVPIMLNSLVSQMQTLIDRIFLGRLDIVYMSAVGNATAPLWTTMAVLFALTTGATILISQAMGAGNKEKAGQYTASMFKFNNIFAFILFLFWMIFPRAVYTVMGVSKTVIGPCITYTRYYAPVFIISGLGAALATTIAEFTGGIVLAVIIIRSRKLETKPSLFTLIKAPFVPYVAAMKMGLPAAAASDHQSVHEQHSSNHLCSRIPVHCRNQSVSKIRQYHPRCRNTRLRRHKMDDVYTVFRYLLCRYDCFLSYLCLQTGNSRSLSCCSRR